MAQNEMRAMRGMPLRVRSMEGLGRWLKKAPYGRGQTLPRIVR